MWIDLDLLYSIQETSCQYFGCFIFKYFVQNLSLPIIRYIGYIKVLSNTSSPEPTELSVVGKHTLAILKYLFELLLQC